MRKYEVCFKETTSILEHFPAIKCSVGISHSAKVPFHLRGQGLGSDAHRFRLSVAKYLDFKYLICTVRKDNDAQHKIMKKFGWKELDSTDTYCHNITMYGRDLSDIEYPNSHDLKKQGSWKEI